MTIKECSDCKHWSFENAGSSKLYGTNYCKHEKSVYENTNKYYLGLENVVAYHPCSVMRSLESMCGKEAKYFEPKGKWRL